MTRFLRVFFLLSGLFLISSFGFAQIDSEGCRDYPALGRVPGFYLQECTVRQYDSATFPVGPAGREKDQVEEGPEWILRYYLKDNLTSVSMLQIVRTFQNAARSSGGQILSEQRGDNWHNTTIRLNPPGKEVWVWVEARDSFYQITVIEKQGMTK